MTTILLAGALACTPVAQAANCIDKHARDPNFMQLAIPENAPGPSSASEFSFFHEPMTVEKLSAKVGPPDGCTASGTSSKILVWSVPDGEVRVSTRDGSNIEQVRHNSKVVYDRKKKK